MKRNTMAQWINLHQNNSFVNWTRLPLLCEKSEVILLVLVGFMAGGRAGGQAGRQASRLSENFHGIKQRDSIIIVLPMHFSQFLR